MTLSDEWTDSAATRHRATRDLFGERDCRRNRASESGLFLWRLSPTLGRD